MTISTPKIARHASAPVFLAILVLLAVLIGATVYISSPRVATAQTLPSGIGGLVIDASSLYPYPGQEITITARSYSIDLNASNISWVVGGVTVQSGIGLTSLKVQAPQPGKTITVAVSAQSPNGARVAGSYIVNSGSVDMIVESSGYTHPLFRGKLAPVYQNTLKITAIPHIAEASGKEIDPTTLVYTWYKNSSVIQDQSGYGKRSITLVGDLVPRPYEISVTVSPRTGGSEVRGSTFIDPTSPTVELYVDDPLYGPLFNRTIGSVLRIGTEKETGVIAVPYGFDKPSGSVGALTLNWIINNIKRTELATNESIRLRAPDGAAGNSSIRLDIRNADKILQGADISFSARFTGGASSGSGSIQNEEIRF